MLLIAGPLSKYTLEYTDQGSTEYQYFSKIFLYKVRCPYEMILPFEEYLRRHYFSASRVKIWYWYSNASFKVFGITCIQFWFGSKIISLTLTINWTLPFNIDVVLSSTSPQKRDSFSTIVLVLARTLFHAVKNSWLTNTFCNSYMP